MKLRAATTGVAVVLAAVWLGFVVHRAPRFAGSTLGVALGIAAAVLMALPIVYVPFRRVPKLRRWVTPHVSIATLLYFHVITGLAGALLAILHTGHRFEHPVGIALTALVLVVAFSGYVGFELLRRLAARRAELTALEPQLRARVANAQVGGAATRAVAVAIADVELDIEDRQRIERWLGIWRVTHVIAAVLLFAVMALHIWTAFYFGVRG